MIWVCYHCLEYCGLNGLNGVYGTTHPLPVKVCDRQRQEIIWVYGVMKDQRQGLKCDVVFMQTRPQEMYHTTLTGATLLKIN